MKSIRKITTYKWIIKKSEFICTLIPCNNEEEIDKIIHQYQEKYHDANHNCIAYIVGNQKRANDNGEPSGTAGLPMLDVLEKNNLTNIIAIVTRYFGGIKLGAGGLTRAYRQSVADALKEADIVEKFSVPLYKITIDYSYTKKFEHLLKVHKVKCINIEYLEQVSYTCYLEDESFLSIIQDLTNNTYDKTYIRNDYIELS
ncbi:YigZ family protein [Thomasclavelia cocleata]|uniref:YigZ family protein n=1 Tax=Thomasclavelia cocleata TaxID=69824 RepID=UPI002432550D|nr:YigZ family protein [Thomasclavelia cocleata]MCI9631482.1 YigZ family protein [Thomasclavelia cocleata]